MNNGVSSGFGPVAMAAFASFLVKNISPKLLQFETTTPPADVYDFVVVGSGCGGSVVASRLSEIGSNVLVLEAGGDAAPISFVPSIGHLWLADEEKWNVYAKPQRNAMQGFINNTMPMMQIKSMGGATMHNGMMFARGGRKDYENWARLGNVGWDYQSVLPYFKKLETFHPRNTPESIQYRGGNGPIPVQEKTTPPNGIVKALFAAGNELGYKVIDPNGKDSVGFANTQVTLKNGIRQMASENYLGLAVGRANLDVRPKATVIRVLFDKMKRAVGVEYIFEGKTRKVYVKKEVILSAGTINTPKILILSGVGPAEQLKKFRIPAVALVEGVGKNLQDHPSTPLVFAVNKGSALTIKSVLDPFQLVKYSKSNSGIFGDTMSEEANAFVHLGNDGDRDWVDVWYMLLSTPMVALMAEFSERGLKPENIKSTILPLRFREGMGLFPTLARPKSRGSVTLKSTNVDDLPIVDANIFGDESDLDLMVKGIKTAYKITKTRAMKSSIAPIDVAKPLRGCRSFPFRSDSYWRCYCRHVTLGGYHLTSTSKMAPASDPLGVVSPRLRVRGVSGLRVVDVSIMPEIVSANTMAAAYMIGEKGADLIKEDWGYPTDTIRRNK